MLVKFVKLVRPFSAGGVEAHPSLGKRQGMPLVLLIFGLIVMLANSAGCGGGNSVTSANTTSSAPTPPTLPQASMLTPACTSAIVGSNYSCKITVSNGKAPFTWKVVGLPPGLTFAVSPDTTTLTISGTPQAQIAIAFTNPRVAALSPNASMSTTASVQITVTDAAGNSATLSFAITVTPSPITIAPTSPLAGGTAGTAYSATLTANGGVAPYSWTVSGLPAGLSVASGTPSATISGTTDQVGAFTLAVTVSDSESPAVSVSATFALTISQASALTISTKTLPNGSVGVAYSQALTSAGGVTPETWALRGALPPGLSLSTAGVISGMPTASGAATFTVRVSDAESPGQVASQVLSITINTAAGGLSITTASPLANGSLSAAYAASVAATGGTPPYNWSLGSSSALPSGLMLVAGPSALIFGTPTATGTFQFTLNVTDSAGTPATAFATFLLTVTGSATVCPTTVNLTLCGTYVYGLRGFNPTGGSTTFGGVFVADIFGHLLGGGQKTNDSVAGLLTLTITGGTYVMDASGDGRGVLTLIYSDASVAIFRFVLESAANASNGLNGIEEFDSTGVLASGVLFGPETPPIAQLPANAVVSTALEGINGASQRAAFLGNFVFGPTGCDGSSGSFNSVAGEPVVTNTAGTVNASLALTGSCTAADPNTGFGTAQVTITGGSPFTSATLHFAYIVVGSVATGGAQGALLLETDPSGPNQPVLSGLMIGDKPPTGGFNATSLGCPCLYVGQGTTNGSVSTGGDIASIVGIATTPGTGANGTLTGVLDQNAAGTITSAGNWPYSSYSIDANGFGTITGAGSPTIHFVASGSGKNGFTIQTVDESSSVQVGSFRMQNSTFIEAPGLPYVSGRDLGVLGVTRSTQHIGGVLVPSGAVSGTITGSIDVISSAGSTPGAAATGTYTSIDSITGRGTGTMNLTAAASSVSVVIHVARHSQFVILDMQSSNPYLIGARTQ